MYEPGIPIPGTITSIKSSKDGSFQKIQYLQSYGSMRPLLVVLHTWGEAYTDPLFEQLTRRSRWEGWQLAFPDFRGANDNPDACASELAVADVLDVVNWAREELDIDPNRIYLAGFGGGGHMALTVASQSPSIWTAVSVWSPIIDLARWYDEMKERSPKYSRQLEAICGGAPGSSEEADTQYRLRSPIHSLWRAHIIPMEINAGIHDGHGEDNPVPVGQSIRAFNELARYTENNDAVVGDDVIESIERNETVPEGVDSGDLADALFSRPVVFRRKSGLTRLNLFEGGHEMLVDTTFYWLSKF